MSKDGSLLCLQATNRMAPAGEHDHLRAVLRIDAPELDLSEEELSTSSDEEADVSTLSCITEAAALLDRCLESCWAPALQLCLLLQFDSDHQGPALSLLVSGILQRWHVREGSSCSLHVLSAAVLSIC